MRYICVIFVLLVSITNSSAQLPTFQEVWRDSVYLKAFQSNIPEMNSILEYGRMKVNLIDTNDVYIEERITLARVKIEDFQSNKVLDDELLTSKIIILCDFYSLSDKTFETTDVELVNYIKYKGHLFILYNFFGMLDNNIIIKATNQDIEECYMEPFNAYSHYILSR